MYFEIRAFVSKYSVIHILVCEFRELNLAASKTWLQHLHYVENQTRNSLCAYSSTELQCDSLT